MLKSVPPTLYEYHHSMTGKFQRMANKKNTFSLLFLLHLHQFLIIHRLLLEFRFCALLFFHHTPDAAGVKILFLIWSIDTKN